jgi:hypothetical protein
VSAHSTIDGLLALKNKNFSGATAGVTTLTAANNTFEAKDLEELIRVAKATGNEVVLNAGALKIRPKDSTL